MMLKDKFYSVRIISLVFGLLLIQACAVGPNAVQQDSNLASSFSGTELVNVEAVIDVDQELQDNWWTLLGDKQLNDLVDRAVAGNLNLSIARARVQEARALRRAASAGLLPSLTASATSQEFELSQNAFGPNQFLADLGIPLDGRLYDASFDAAWELDLFGLNRSSKDAATNRVAQLESNRRDITVTIIAEIARNYVELRGAQRRLEVVEKNIRIQSDTAEIVRNRYDTGLASELDLTRAEAQLRSIESQRPPLRAAIRGLLYQLATLLGEQPQALLAELSSPQAIPFIDDVVPVGLPSDLVWRRNDVRSAEFALRAAMADQRVAQANLYPRFFLTGALSQEGTTFSDLYDSAARAWSFGPLVQWPLFQGGALRAQRDAARSRSEVAYASFQQSVLVALQEVETQLVAYAEAQLRFQSLQEAATSSNRSVELASILYDRGLEDFLTVLDAERSLAQLEDQLIVSETDTTVQLVALFKALGGGWESFETD